MYSCKLKGAYSINKMLIFSECLLLIHNVRAMHECLEKHVQKCWKRKKICYLLCDLAWNSICWCVAGLTTAHSEFHVLLRLSNSLLQTDICSPTLCLKQPWCSCGWHGTGSRALLQLHSRVRGGGGVLLQLGAALWLAVLVWSLPGSVTPRINSCSCPGQ